MSKICSKDFFKKCTYNEETQTQLWMSQIADSHDNCCSCTHPFAHLLSSIFPPGHRDRLLTINQILDRDYRELCLSGGGDEEKTGSGDGGGPDTSANIKQEEGDDLPGDEIEKLLAAAAEEDTR